MKTCIVIVGPTAVGKTAFAIEVAKHFSTQIISADSRQCFKEMNIGVARPFEEELTAVHHYFISSHSIQETVNAGTFEKYALDKVNEIFSTNDIAVMVGGTGLYIKSFCEGIDEIPAVKEEVRQTIITNYNKGGIEWLQEQIEKNDHQYFVKGEILNPQRMMRALEVKLSTGKSIIEFQTRKKQQRDFNIIKIGLEMPRELLYDRINKRVDLMMEKGLLDEVKSLLPYKDLNALQTVGYTELFKYLSGEISLEVAVDAIKQNSRHYAKRQMTWFKKDETIKWVNDLKIWKFEDLEIG
ncbi:tRNA (adenosine(37)-N6)-dimethylallyltransferase MiaA [Ferruginibacter sp. SUN002]|uniref:tRNA (adenosine(37)-N6)-dimethylallyltransferase MiaA n=1 Tax=Ferruginibacter sp. SUN002 TaxID=2937789 RepID=UPI003D36DE77